MIGARTVIVSNSGDDEKEAAGRIWFELQRLGIQSSFLHLASPFPTVNNIQESIVLFKRTGSKSILSIGNGSVTDYSRAIRCCVEQGKSISQIYDTQHLGTLSQLQEHSKKDPINLICIPTTPSPFHFSDTFDIVHKEEDLLISLNGRAPEVRRSLFLYYGLCIQFSER